ncbi:MULTISPECIES: hypothetical protein [Bacillaceae]|uniref:Uncharacterized protein n=1 Tax=Shouchella miscanthi TaxID=2598861 RepID=A0ABU6NQ08_9BACI|nr:MULTISPECIES: hypothetical protein [Bacillaceae]MED4130278.1 hypothetical protein [Shouchella miscanthi]
MKYILYFLITFILQLGVFKVLYSDLALTVFHMLAFSVLYTLLMYVVDKLFPLTKKKPI